MPTPPKKRGRSKEGRRPGARKKSSKPVLGKEVDYLLQLTEEDTRLLHRYKDIMAQGAAGFAETVYNYLFDNPDIADVL
ncbi:MAG: hypothetical protein ABF290_16705, partial [Thiogranum sp.]